VLVMADVLEPAVHHSIVLVDVEGFGARHRTRADQGAIRHGLYQALELAFTRSGVGWDGCYREDRGDGVLILVPPQVPKTVLAAGVPGELAAAVRAHNQGHGRDARMRLRLALHGGEVAHDAYGVTGTAVTVAFRLLEAGPLKQALAGSPGVLAVIASAWFYEEVIRQAEGCAPATWRRVLVAVKETRQDGWVSLPDAPYPADRDADLPAVPAAAAEVRYSLPPDAAAFTGRGEELSRVTAAVAAAAGAGGVVAVRAIDGMPGAGKTALAVHAAHVLREEFPDRQLFIDLHAHTPGREPVRPEDALAALLAAAGVDPRFLPGDLDGRAGMWRDKMAGQRALLVLDNAAGTSQVAPLLPGGGGCLVLVTSRRHLGDLPGAVTPVLLDVLPPQQAAEMFTRLASRAAGSPGEVAEVVRLAGFLPLAISLLARLFARHPAWTLAGLAAETRQSLLTLTAENDSITAAFEVSYRHLDPARQRLFRLLGLHPGATADGYAAAALAGTSVTEAAGLLDGLHGEGLLTETGHRRYGMHDLLRRYARDHAAAGPAQDAERALERLLDYYQHTAARAEARLARQTRPGPPPAAPAGLTAAPDLDDDGQALAWARADRASLLACLDHATTAGQHARVIALTAALAGLLRRDGPWADAITRHTAAARAAQRLGDRLGQANALTDLGAVRQLTGDYPGAAQDQEQALGIYRDLGDRLGQANALNELGVVRLLTGDYPGAPQDQEQALGIYRDLGDRLGQAGALSELGAVRRLTGDYPAAAQDLEQALGISRDLGDRPGQAHALSELGVVRRLTGDYPAAARDQEQALGIYRDLGYRLGQASALSELGVTRRVTGDYPAAAQAQEQALGIYRDLGDRLGQAHALSELGVTRRVTGDYPAAAQALEQALGICRDLGDRGGEAEVLNERGTLHRVCGELAGAEGCHRQALELARAIASSWDEAHALAGLGRCALAGGHATQAGVLLRQALEIFQRIGAAEAPDVLAELDAL
jgi:tetratricopeptide (TPR) repeat protein